VSKPTEDEVLSRMLEDARELVKLLSNPIEDDAVYYLCEDLAQYARHIFEAARNHVVKINGVVQVDVESF
jgi:hypothetical protein